MPIDVKFVHGGAGVILCCSGTVTGEELYQANDVAYSSDETIRRIQFVYIDASSAEAANISLKEFSRCVFQDYKAASVNSGIITAIASTHDAIQGVVKAWEVLMGNSDMVRRTKVFRDKGSAEAWIKEMTGLDIAG